MSTEMQQYITWSFSSIALLGLHKNGLAYSTFFKTGECQYICGVCQKSFRHCSDLSRHKETHKRQVDFQPPTNLSENLNNNTFARTSNQGPITQPLCSNIADNPALHAADNPALHTADNPYVYHVKTEEDE